MEKYFVLFRFASHLLKYFQLFNHLRLKRNMFFKYIACKATQKGLFEHVFFLKCCIYRYFSTLSNLIEVNGDIYKINDQQRMTTCLWRDKRRREEKRRSFGNVRLSLRFLNFFFTNSTERMVKFIQTWATIYACFSCPTC